MRWSFARLGNAGTCLAPTSEAFRRWFAGSRVVDSTGCPLTVWHGTKSAGFPAFDPKRVGKQTDSGYMGWGFYFAHTPQHAAYYAGMDGKLPRDFMELIDPAQGYLPTMKGTGGLYPVFLRIERPLVLEDRIENGRLVDAVILVRDALGLPHDALASSVTVAAFRRGHDGVIYRHLTRDGTPSGSVEYVVYRPEQIKSIYATSFSPTSILLDGFDLFARGRR